MRQGDQGGTNKNETKPSRNTPAEPANQNEKGAQHDKGVAENKELLVKAELIQGRTRDHGALGKGAAGE